MLSSRIRSTLVEERQVGPQVGSGQQRLGANGSIGHDSRTVREPCCLCKGTAAWLNRGKDDGGRAGHGRRRQGRPAQAALDYHRYPKPGKLEIRATKPLANGRDLARAYSPGVAEACLEIKADPATARDYTSRGNLVAVVSNGTAVLGLGNIGALASKPVMEGKAVLFKKFANIDCFDIELNEADPEKLAAIVCALEPTFGAINLEDIKAPDCFVVEKLCRERMNIPVFHDDQHGTAIVVGAATTNALRVLGKRFEDLRIVSTGGGAAGQCLPRHAGEAGRPAREHLPPRPRGLVLHGRQRGDDRAEGGLCPRAPRPRRCRDVIEGADMFLGLSGPTC
jgi:malate dehydrogenase (oxaloacetate-decarboxylating)(NADP+)